MPAASPLSVDVFPPVDHAYEYPGVPSCAMTFADPSLLPLHKASVELVDAVSSAGSVMSEFEKAVQPLASVTVTEYNPAVSPASVAPLPPEDQEYVYPGVPSIAVAVADPSLPPLHETSADDTETVSSTGSLITAEALDVHPFASVTTTVYDPAGREFSVALFPVFIQFSVLQLMG